MRDAVCKMELDERHVKESLVYREKNYYFCSVGCRAEFERYPELMEIERHGSRVETSFLYQRGRQSNHDQFYTRQVREDL